MSYLEGVGDEVTVLFTVLFLLILLYVAWLSTGVVDRPLVRVVVLDRRRFQDILLRLRNTGRIITSHVTQRAFTVTNSTNQQQGNENNDPDRSQESLPLNSTENIPSEIIENVSPNSQQNKPSTDTSTDSSLLNRKSIQRTLSQTNEVQEPSADLSSETTEIEPSVLDSFLESTQQPLQNDTPHTTQQDDPSSSPRTTQQEEPLSSPATVLEQKMDQDIETTQTGHSSQPADRVQEISRDSPIPGSNEEASSTGLSEEAMLDGHIRIRLKYLDDRQKLVQAKPEDTIGQFKRQHFAGEMAENFAVRFIFRGQELREDLSTLQAYHIEDNSVVHCLLSRITQSEPSTHQHRRAELDLGFLMFPLFAVILGIIWYCRITYRNYFSAMSTLSLIGITFLFAIASLATFRRGVHDHDD